LEQIRHVAMHAAQKAGELISGNFQKLQNSDIQAKGKNDFVTRIDKEAESIISHVIGQKFPDHRILAEESGLSRQNSEYLWVIDPLDGTTNFIQGIPHFSVSLALLIKGTVVFGLIYDPLSRECFHAAAGQGAFLNESRIAVSRTSQLESAFGATGFPFKAPQFLEPYTGVFKVLMSRCQDMRRCGSAALDLAYTACGRYDFFWEAHLLPWDFMAGKLIVEEAGGKTSDFQGRDLPVQTSSVLAANLPLYPLLLDVIRGNFSKSTGHSSR